jgi:hypothetical protein
VEISKAVKEYTAGADNMSESIPPLPCIEVSDYTQRQYIDQQRLDRAMCIIYEQRPDFFLKSVERDRKYERDKTTDEKARFHDGFFDELSKFIREEVRKEIKIPGLAVTGIIVAHVRAVARKMYG